jgi:glycine cleavage system H protein
MTLLFSHEHQWIDLDDPTASPVGITVHAQETLGDIVFVELPEIGRNLRVGEVAAVVESVKAASDVFMPMSGEVVAVNEALRADPSLANSDPQSTGWFFKIRLKDLSESAALLDEQSYVQHASNGDNG